MALFAPKGLRAEVTEGIDLEQGVTLTGDKITVGSGPADDLRLGASDIVPAHLTLQRRADGKGWDYFTSDRGQTLVDKGNPRTGTVRPGMWFRLGTETRIALTRTTLPATETTDPAEKTTVPLPVALGIMAVMVVGFGLVLTSLGAPEDTDDRLFTAAWYDNTVPLDPSLATCLSHDITPTRTIAATAPDAAFWQYILSPNRDGSEAAQAQATLTRQIRNIITEAHLLRQENKPLEASQALRRLEYVLPLGTADCPILAAARVDLARLELSANR